MNRMKKYSIAFISVIFVVSLAARIAFSHCEIPCGIYDDKMRSDLIQEHTETIEKSMKTIRKLQKEKDVNWNQLVRWVHNKEEHADEIQEIATQYFMFQRIKPAEKSDEKKYDKYILELTAMHRISVFAMKCKQTTDVEHVKKIRKHLKEFNTSYFGGK